MAGTAEMRQEVAECLLVACRHNFTDPEVQQHLMEVKRPLAVLLLAEGTDLQLEWVAVSFQL